jgi:transglutaminase-like putative cysteine protease
MERYLRSTEVIDWTHPEVLAHARVLAAGSDDRSVVARRCFEWVRDEIRHTRDHRLPSVTCAASEVLRLRSGYCYAKSHLLAALLRANGMRAGLCYQRLSRDGQGPPFCLHGLNAVYLPDVGWYRVDPRGNRAGVDARFIPPAERLPFVPSLPGEADLPEVFADPLPAVVEALRSHVSADDLWELLPDVALWRNGTPRMEQNSGSHARDSVGRLSEFSSMRTRHGRFETTRVERP